MIRVGARLQSRIASNRAAWKLTDRWAITLFVMSLVVVPIAILLALADQPWFHSLTNEDGLVEWTQVAALLIAGGAYLVIARRAWQARMRTLAGVALLVAIAALVVAGEEISWGQRLFGLTTPAALEDINYQGETTIHNIRSLATASRLVQFGAAGFGAVLPLLALLLPPVSARVRDSYFLPPLALVPFFLGPFLYWAARIPMEPTEAVLRASEVTELSFYLGIALVALLSVRRLGSGRQRTAAEPVVA